MPARLALSAFTVDAGVPGTIRGFVEVRAVSADCVTRVANNRAIVSPHNPLPKAMSLAVVLATLELDLLHSGDLCSLRDSSPEAVLEFRRNAFFESANSLKLESELHRGGHHFSLPVLRHLAE